MSKYEEEDEDNEYFQDSLDRILSSSNTSCSGSPSISEPEEEYDRFTFRNYDVWISEPSSVQERRVHLLREMGISLSHSSDQLDPGEKSPTIGDSSNSNNVAENVDGDRNLGQISCNSLSDGNSSFRSSIRVTENEEMSSVLGLNETDNNDNDKGVCMIKNLDNGKEFVVNEVRDDGMWEKIKEVTMDEFSSEMCVGNSPIVQELMRRQNFEDRNDSHFESNREFDPKSMKRGSWIRSIKNVANSFSGRERRSSDDRDTSSSTTDDSNEASFHLPERIRVRQYGKSFKEFTGVYKSQEIQAHNGSIWAIKFSLDGKYLASAGDDCVICVWRVVESEKRGDFVISDKSEDGNLRFLAVANGSPECSSVSPDFDRISSKKRRGRSSLSRKSVSFEQILVPENAFGLSEKPVCSFEGHLDDVLDLSWSKSQQLLSSSMDKTVRLWDLERQCCLKIFSHSDYVTCIQFNPADDRYFISGSLDGKVRIWSIPDRKVTDWNDLHEMVTAASYTPDGKGALVGTYKGSCQLYNTTENKLQQKCQINLQNKKKKSHQKKVTGFQFTPGSTSEVLVTSADSRIRVIDGVDLVHKFKGFRNTNSQISASLSSNGKYVVSASEDSYVYIWKHETTTRPNRTKTITVSRSCELFHCQDVSMAIPWPGIDVPQETCLKGQNGHFAPFNDESTANHLNTPGNVSDDSPLVSDPSSSSINGIWSAEKLFSSRKSNSPRVSLDSSNWSDLNKSAWGMVIVTAGLRGEISIFQNFGLPVRT